MNISIFKIFLPGRGLFKEHSPAGDNTPPRGVSSAFTICPDIIFFVFLAFSLILFFFCPASGNPSPGETRTFQVETITPGQDSTDSLSRVAVDSLAAQAKRTPKSFPGLRSSETLNLPEQKKDESLSLVWVFSSILIVLGLLILFLHILRKFIYRPLGGVSLEGQFKLLHQFHLGPKKSIALVRVYHRLLLLGVTETSITLLSEITDPDEIARIETNRTAPGKQQTADFRNIYQGLLSRMKKK